MRSVNRLFSPPKPSASADTTTAHGLPSFKRPIEEQLLQALLCNTIQDTFYADKKGLMEETKRVHLAAIEKDTTFYAKALVYARTRGLMRTQSVYGLALLASRSQDLDVGEQAYNEKTDRTSSYFEAIFDEVIRTPNDLADFHAIIRGLKGNDGGRRVKRVAGNWLRSRLSEYWAIKYGGEKKGAFALRDLFKIYHPQAYGSYPGKKTLDQAPRGKHGHSSKPLVAWLQGARDVDIEGLPQIEAFERLKRATSTKEKVAAIIAGKLPHEVATTFAGKDAEVWKAIVSQMPAFALTRNLATIERAGIMSAVRATIVEKLTSPHLAKAKIFPFQFLLAMEHVNDQEVKDALRVGLEIALGGAETIQGKTLVALDISGSMGPGYGNFITKAAIFAVATARRAPGSQMILFDDRVDDYPVSRVDSVLTQAERIRVRGGTDHGGIVRWLQSKGERFDNVIVVTDEQQERGSPFADKVAEWRSGRLGKGSKFFICNLAPYTARGGLLPAGENNFAIFGLTEASIQFLAKAAQGWGKFVDEIHGGFDDGDDVAGELEAAT